MKFEKIGDKKGEQFLGSGSGRFQPLDDVPDQTARLFALRNQRERQPPGLDARLKFHRSKHFRLPVIEIVTHSRRQEHPLPRRQPDPAVVQHQRQRSGNADFQLPVVRVTMRSDPAPPGLLPVGAVKKFHR
ncbi:hypothetical protein SDC9_191195 [bioreactor metagenome]|uniref:Uncharacterized protein n=1 Tax=bioreactor metagenome TaxID=1076179 RepID=A0A645HX77_9ZZZZ